MTHYWNLLWDWNTLDSIRKVHNFLEGGALVFFALLVLFDVLAHLSEDEKPVRAKLLERIGLWCFGVAVLSEIVAYPYSQRNDTLSSQQDAARRDKIAALDNSTQSLKTAAETAHKEAEDEKMARVQLQKLVAWRTITATQQKEIAVRLRRFSGVRIAFTTNAGDPEGLAFGTQIAAIAMEAGWSIIAFAPVEDLGHFRTGVRITTTGDDTTRHASDALTRELNGLKFNAVRSPEIDPRSTDPLKRPLMYVFVGLRPQAIPNQVSKAIAAQK
jgi:hypothetical protein